MAGKPVDQQQYRALHAAVAAGRYAEAVQLGRKLARKHPRNTDVLYLAGSAQFMSGDEPGAVKTYQRILRIDAAHPAANHDLAMICRVEGRISQAHQHFDRVLARYPDQETVAAAKGELLAIEGRYDDALQLLQPFLKRDDPPLGIAVTYAGICQRRRQWRAGIDVLDRAMPGRAGEADVNYTEALFLLGQLREGAGAYDEAFEAYRSANARVNSFFDPDAFDRRIDQTTRRWTRAAVDRLSGGESGEDDDGRGFVFIVGMPRSGTSLVEQILASHPQVEAGGELRIMPQLVAEMIAGFDTTGVPILADPSEVDPPRLERAKHAFHARRGAEARYLTDKLPTNFLHLGLISLMLPDARVIHCRRDPRDTCISCYSMMFAGGNNPWCYGLNDLARFYRAYRRLMDHWKQMLDLQILDVRYEDLVDGLESNIRRLLDFLDLPFDERCLRFHETKRTTLTASNAQVRQPIYRGSIDRWKRFERHLAPLIEELER